jgi:hypothetical protein
MGALNSGLNIFGNFYIIKNSAGMKERLDPVSISNFVTVVKRAVQNSGYRVEDIDLLLPLHTKKSMFHELLKELGLNEDQAQLFNGTATVNEYDSIKNSCLSLICNSYVTNIR